MALRPRLIRENSPGEQLFLRGGIPFSCWPNDDRAFICDKLLGGNLGVFGLVNPVKLHFS